MILNNLGNLDRFMKWLKISISIFCLILLVIGFGLGYFYNNYTSGACIDKPLSYGISKLNDMNNANFTCSCSSAGIEPFSFTENGLVSDYMINPQIISYP
jgi:hypothetical protein